jgi:hypothetical protein
MSAKDDAITIAITKGETGTDSSAGVECRRWLIIEERWRRGGIHTSYEVGPSKLVPKTARNFRRGVDAETAKTTGVFGPMSGGLNFDSTACAQG